MSARPSKALQDEWEAKLAEADRLANEAEAAAERPLKFGPDQRIADEDVPQHILDIELDLADWQAYEETETAGTDAGFSVAGEFYEADSFHFRRVRQPRYEKRYRSSCETKGCVNTFRHCHARARFCGPCNTPTARKRRSRGPAFQTNGSRAPCHVIGKY